jgi:hypothetical protein
MGLIIFCARATRGLRRPSLDARSRRPIRPILEETTSELGKKREWPGALLARGTRTIGMCSFDARSRGQPRPHPSREMRNVGRPSIDARSVGGEGMEGHPRWSCAPGARALRRKWRGSWYGLCARRAPMVEQWSLDARKRGSTRPLAG